MKVYEPSMLDQEPMQVLPFVEELAPEAQTELVEDTITQKKLRTIV